PAAFQPISAASIDPGPGAARDSANRSANSRSLVQLCTLMACCAISAITALPPPNDSSDRGAKTTPSATRVSPKPRMSAPQRLRPGQPDAERRAAQDDWDQRPAQHADAPHCQSGDGPGDRLRRAME